MNIENLDYTKTIPDRFNPFNNNTENLNYRDDYRKIVPQISASGCIIPEQPSQYEKKNIKRIYNKTSFVLIFHLIVSSILAGVLSILMTLIASKTLGYSNLENFFKNSSYALSLTAITYTILNVCSFLLGCKILNIPIKNVFNKPKVSTLNMARHISIAWCFQGACMIIVNILYSLFSIANIDLIPESVLDNADYSNLTYCIVMFLYSCVIAPITEEMLFRGVVLRGFSVVSQRFGIFISALLFGLLHGNILQFITTFCVGIYLGFIATKYNSILPTIVIHFFINLAPTLMELAFNDNETLYNIVIYAFYGVMITLGIIFICLGFKKQSNRLPLQNTLQKRRTLPLAISSVGVVSIIIIYVISMVLNHIM